MAKAKVSFDSARLKQFFLLHGEKLALGIGVVLSAYLAYGATQVEPYAKKPDDLQKAVKLGREKLDHSHVNTPTLKRFDIVEDNIRLPTERDRGFKEVITEELVTPLAAAKFAGGPINLPLFEKKSRRKEPPFLAVRDLRTVFYKAAVNMKGANPDTSVPYGEEFIVVSGVVPFEEQSAAHIKAFQNALDPTTNAIPQYTKYELRRAELKTSDPNEAVDWAAIEPLDLQAAVVDWINKWPGDLVFGVDPSIVSWPGKGYGPLTEPLPPLTNNDYGPWANHPELLSAAPAPAPNQPGPAVQPAQPVVPKPARDPFGRPMAAPAAAVQPAAAAILAPVEEGAKERPKQLLFRFLDFNVEQGKRYRYQVKLILANPNLNLDQAQLEKPEFAVGETRDAPWSDPSTIAEVPFLDRQFAGHLKLPSGDLEPEAGMGVKWWFPELAAEGYLRFEEIKGTAAVGISIIGKMRGAALAGNEKVSYISAGKREPTTVQITFPPLTPPTPKMLVVDFGWEKLETRPKVPPNERPINRPTELLLLNPRGQLQVFIQTMDAGLWNEQRAAAGAAGGNGAPQPVPPQPAGLQLLGGAAGGNPPAAVPTATPTSTVPVLKLQ